MASIAQTFSNLLCCWIGRFWCLRQLFMLFFHEMVEKLWCWSCSEALNLPLSSPNWEAELMKGAMLHVPDLHWEICTYVASLFCLYLDFEIDKHVRGFHFKWNEWQKVFSIFLGQINFLKSERWFILYVIPPLNVRFYVYGIFSLTIFSSGKPPFYRNW